jgi:hypothetical protein
MARKNRGLPFVVQPRLQPIIERIGTEESGIIEIERKGYLTVAEKAIVQGGMSGSDSMAKAMAKVQAIAVEAGVEPSQVFEDMASGTVPDYLRGHDIDMLEVVDLMKEHEDRTRLVAATALLITRIDPEWDPKDTSELHPDIQDGLYALYNDEEKKSVEALEAALAEKDKAQDSSSGKTEAKTK